MLDIGKDNGVAKANEQINGLSPSKHILASSRDYALYVCSERAIPCATDGMKSSQRIASWVMKSRAGEIKVAALAGAMIESNLYVHGGAGGTIAGMAGPYINNVPVFDGRGNFGTIVAPSEMAADRYIYVKKSEYLKSVIYPDVELAPEVESIDGDTKMPRHFLPLLPHVLVNGTSGMGIGWSTNVLGRHPEDLKQAVIRVLRGEPVNGRSILPWFRAYDGIAIERIENNRDDAESFTFTGRVEVVNTSTVRITHLTPGVSMDAIQERLDGMIEKGRISDYENNTTDRVDIVVKMRRDQLSEVKDELAAYFGLRTRETERLVMVDFDHSAIRQFRDLDEYLPEWVMWRMDYFVKRFERIRDAAAVDHAFLKAIIAAFRKGILKRLPGFTSREMLKLWLTDEVGMSRDFADRISGFPTYRWTADEITKVERRIEELEELVRDCDRKLHDHDLIRDVWVAELEALKF